MDVVEISDLLNSMLTVFSKVLHLAVAFNASAFSPSLVCIATSRASSPSFSAYGAGFSLHDEAPDCRYVAKLKPQRYSAPAAHTAFFSPFVGLCLPLPHPLAMFACAMVFVNHDGFLNDTQRAYDDALRIDSFCTGANEGRGADLADGSVDSGWNFKASVYNR